VADPAVFLGVPMSVATTGARQRARLAERGLRVATLPQLADVDTFAAAEVVAGHTPIAFSSLAPASQQIQAGNLRALAVTAEKRVESLPDVPTMAEAGFPGQIGETPIGILAPTGTPAPIIDGIHRKVVASVALADVKQRLATLGFSPVGDTPAEFAAALKAEGSKWAEVIREAGIKLQ